MSFDDLAKRMGGGARRSFALQTPAQLARANQRADANRQILWGAILLGIGLVITVATFGSAAGGGTYIIAYGPMISGAVNLVRGLMHLPDRTPEEIAAASRVDPSSSP